MKDGVPVSANYVTTRRDLSHHFFVVTENVLPHYRLGHSESPHFKCDNCDGVLQDGFYVHTWASKGIVSDEQQSER